MFKVALCITKDSRQGTVGVKRWKWGGAIPLPIRLGGLGERRELPSGVQGGAPVENKFGAFYVIEPFWRKKTQMCPSTTNLRK